MIGIERIRTKLLNTNKKGFGIFTELVMMRRMKLFAENFSWVELPPVLVTTGKLISSGFMKKEN